MCNPCCVRYSTCTWHKLTLRIARGLHDLGRKLRLYMFLLSISIFCLLFFFVMYARLLRPLNLHKLYLILLCIPLLLVSFSPYFAMRSSRWLKPQSEFEWLADASYIVMVFAILLFLLVLVRDLVMYAVRLAQGFGRKSTEPREDKDQAVSRREFIFGASSAGVVGASLVMTPISYYQAKHHRIIRREVLQVPDLPAHLDGLSIAHLSDIHVGNTIKQSDVAAIVQETNALNPDIVAITGDIADGYPELIGSELEPLRGLRARYGSYYCCGNHENMWDGEGWRSCVQSLGIHVFRNEHLILQNVAGGPLAIAGVIDYRGDRRAKLSSSPAQALASIPKDIYTIMLVHQPKSVDPSVDLGADLVLLGHTHGGQFFPLTLLMPYIHEYAHGLYYRGKSIIQVSCGTGYWGPPMRLGKPAEIVHLTLRKA